MLRLICAGYKPAPRGSKKEILPPFPNMHSIQDFPKEVTPAQRLIALTEQYILAYYFYAGNKETLYKDYLQTVRTALFALPAASDDGITKEQYHRYHHAMRQMLETNPSGWLGIDLVLGAYHILDHQHRVMSRLFYEPLLYSLTGIKPVSAEADVIIRPELYTPKLHTEQDQLYVVRRTTAFTTFRCRPVVCTVDQGNFLYKHLAQFDWRGKNIGTLVELLAGFHTQPSTTHDSLPAAMHNALYGELTGRSYPYKAQCKEFTTLLHVLYDNYRISIEESAFSDILQTVGGYPTLRYLTAKSPTIRDEKEFSQFPELAFLKPSIRQRLVLALEAAEAESATTEPNEDDPLATGSDNNDIGEPDTSGGATTSEDDFAGDTTDLDMGDDGMGMGDEMGDTSSGFGGSTGELTAQVTDTPPDEQKDDPQAVLFEVSASETVDEYLFRLRAKSAIRALLINPPAKMKQSTIRFLRKWLTQWINLLSVDSTRDVLAWLTNLIRDEDKPTNSTSSK